MNILPITIEEGRIFVLAEAPVLPDFTEVTFLRR